MYESLTRTGQDFQMRIVTPAFPDESKETYEVGKCLEANLNEPLEQK